MVVSTLNELPQLRDSGFGQPWPRHGLNLLFWFANDYIDFSNKGNISLRFRPQKGEFGFHKYHNRIDDDEDNIVPVPTQDFKYFEVGNLNSPGAENLPNYVRGNNRNIPDGNKDRIIVRLDANGTLNRVYVTEHIDPKRFDKYKTFRVSQGLLQKIKIMSRENYLSKVSNTRDIRGGYKSSGHTERAPQNDSWCAIL